MMVVWAKCFPKNCNKYHVAVNSVLNNVLICSAATSHPFGVPEHDVSVPTVVHTSNGDGDDFELSTLPVYSAEDEGICVVCVKFVFTCACMRTCVCVCYEAV